MALPSISHKTNRILRLVLAALFLILFRIWHLSVLQREEKLSEAQKSQRKTHLIKANRGTICDRFHIPLALNRICYNAVIYYSHIAQIPASRWKSNELGVQVKTFPRKEYIKHLSQVLARELGIDPLRAEDEIHSKASLFPDAPYVIKADLTEKEHFRLCQLERDHPGLHVGKVLSPGQGRSGRHRDDGVHQLSGISCDRPGNGNFTGYSAVFRTGPLGRSAFWV